MKRIISCLFLLSLILTLFSCQEEDIKQGPKVSTLEAEQSETYRTVSVKGRVSGLEAVALDFECGIEYSTSESYLDDATYRVKANKNYSEDIFTIDLDRLESGRTYYYRAYYINQSLIYYGESKSFSFEWTSQLSIKFDVDTITIGVNKTRALNVIVTNGFGKEDYPITWSSSNPSIATVNENGIIKTISEGTVVISATCREKTALCTLIIIESVIEYVDLGLRVNWATCNVGAIVPEEYGNYYSWGELETKEVYSEMTYKWYDGATYTKYNKIDNLARLNPEDDVAHVRWGGDWRMPTAEEWDELYNSCVWKKTTQNGVSGYKITSKKNGYTNCFIFLPAAGIRYGTQIDITDNQGYYWSSSISSDDPAFVRCFYFNTNNGIGNYGRYNGRSVRPVCPSETWLERLSITLEFAKDTLDIPYTTEIYAVVKDGSGDIIDTIEPITWSSSNTRIATVDDKGVVTPLSDGTVVISATCYGKTVSCTLIVRSPFENGYEFVDLGLSVKWASLNIGATTPEEYGDYYAWGEIETKSVYSWDNYKYCNGSAFTMTKYCNSSRYGEYGYNGFIDNKSILEPGDDVAHMKWGGKWRMPTKDEYDELYANCSCVWTTQNGVAGYKITSRKPGYFNRSIFLPAAGHRLDTRLLEDGTRGNYWTSTLHTDEPCAGRRFGFSQDKQHGTFTCSRYWALPVRPVCK